MKSEIATFNQEEKLVPNNNLCSFLLGFASNISVTGYLFVEGKQRVVTDGLVRT